MNTKIVYMYRDVNNYKQHREIIVAGEVTMEQLLDCCEEVIVGVGGDFLPEQVGLPALQEQMCSPVNYDEDGVWHELTGVEPTTNDNTVAITAQDLLENFRKAKGNWDEEEEMRVVGIYEEAK